MYDFPLNFQCAKTITKTMIRACFAKTLPRLDVKVRPWPRDAGSSSGRNKLSLY
jgi:hypothetical protein